MSQKNDLEYLSLIEESEETRYDSRAVFSDVGIGVEVEQYDDFQLYEWHSPTDFDELLEAVEPLYPLTVDPGLEMIREKGRIRDADEDHVTIDNDLVYDPVAEWRGKERWDEYSLIQINLNGAKVAWDEKEKRKDPRIRVYSIQWGPELFADIFNETVDKEETEEIIEDVREVF